MSHKIIYAKLTFILTIVCAATAPIFGAPDITLSTTPKVLNEWLDLHESMVEDAKARADDIQIVLLGDSITRRWTAGAGRALREEHYDPYGCLNLGISADRIEHVIWRLEDGVLDPVSPKMVLLMIGTNNLQANSAEEIAYGVWKIVDILRTENPDTRVLVQGIFPRSKPAGSMEKIQAINEYLSQLDDGEMVRYTYFGDKFLNQDGSLNTTWFTDGLHPEKPEAFQIWADSVQPFVDAWLSATPVQISPPSPPVAAPSKLKIVTPQARKDWEYKVQRFVAQTERSKGHLLFLGDTTLSRLNTIKDALYDSEYQKYDPVFGAIWGNRTENILWQIEQVPQVNIAPKLIVIQMQENLVSGGGTTPEQVAAGVKAIVDELATRYPDTRFLLESTLPLRNGKATSQMIEYNQRLQSIAKAMPQADYLDLVEVFQDRPSNEIPVFSRPTKEAYQAWIEARRPLVEAVFQSK